jgi:hypothetical protein
MAIATAAELRVLVDLIATALVDKANLPWAEAEATALRVVALWANRPERTITLTRSTPSG